MAFGQRSAPGAAGVFVFFGKRRHNGPTFPPDSPAHDLQCARMRLTTKGLLLIAIPAVFELALLSGLVEAQSDAAQAERWALHSGDVLRQTAAVVDPVLSESVALRGAVLADNARFATPVAVWVDVDRRIDRLAELVADNPAQVERVVQMRQAVQAYRQWSDRIQDLLRSGRRHDVLDRFSDLGRADVLDRFRQQVLAFQAEERRLDTLRSTAASVARERQQSLIIAAAVGSLLFVALAVWLFTRGVRGRLARLSDNAGRLASNEPLAPFSPGRDEIARLDLTLHETSRRLLEAERIEARFRADLARRAGELARINETLRQQTQENEMFIYSVSHDLRAPLVNLQGFSKELTRAGDELRAAVRESSLAAGAAAADRAGDRRGHRRGAALSADGRLARVAHHRRAAAAVAGGAYRVPPAEGGSARRRAARGRCDARLDPGAARSRQRWRLAGGLGRRDRARTGVREPGGQRGELSGPDARGQDRNRHDAGAAGRAFVTHLLCAGQRPGDSGSGSAAAFQRVPAAARQRDRGRRNRPCARAPDGGAARRTRVGRVERRAGHDVLSVAARSGCAGRGKRRRCDPCQPSATLATNQPRPRPREREWQPGRAFRRCRRPAWACGRFRAWAAAPLIARQRAAAA